MNAIISGKMEKQAGGMIWETFQTKEFNVGSSYYVVYNVSTSDWIRLIERGGAISAILPVSSIWRKSTTASATRLYPVHNDLTYYIMLYWEDNMLRITSSYDDSDYRVDAVYDKAEIGTLKY